MSMNQRESKALCSATRDKSFKSQFLITSNCLKRAACIKPTSVKHKWLIRCFFFNLQNTHLSLAYETGGEGGTVPPPPQKKANVSNPGKNWAIFGQ